MEEASDGRKQGINERFFVGHRHTHGMADVPTNNVDNRCFRSYNCDKTR